MADAVMAEGHELARFEQHPHSLTWRALCVCRNWRGHWRGSPDRATEDVLMHKTGDDSGGTVIGLEER
jgi:hypothetical protein